MKQCEICGGICPVCHVYVCLVWDMPLSPSVYAGSWFVLWWGLSHCSVSVHAPVWGVQSSMCAVLLCVHVLVPGDVISSGHTVSDWSSWSMHAWVCILSYLIFSDKISSGVVVVCLSSVHYCIFSSFLFIWIEWSKCIYGYHNRRVGGAGRVGRVVGGGLCKEMHIS